MRRKLGQINGATRTLIVREFLSKMRLAGLEPTTRPSWKNGAPADLAGWGVESDVKTILVPGSPPFWWVVDSHFSTADPMSLGHYEGNRVELEELARLTTWEPSYLREALMRHLPS
jgi:hypothetical protein